MDDFPLPKPQRVDDFVVSVAAKLRVAECASHEEAVSAALLILRDRLYRDFGPDDIVRLAVQMRNNAKAEVDTAVMRAQFALPFEGIRREVRMNREGQRG